MSLTLILLIQTLTLTTSRSTVYMCGDKSYADEQCLFEEILGNVTFTWVRKCKGAKVCVKLPYYNKIIGACNVKVRTHYDHESCANDNKCTSGICDGTKCKGYPIGHSCIMGLGQCERGLVCRYTNIKDEITTCQSPIQKDQSCIHPSVSEMTIKDDESSIYGSNYSFFVPWYNPCDLDLICRTNSWNLTDKTTGTCIELASLPSGNVNNPMLCTKGLMNISDSTCLTNFPNDVSTCDPKENFLCQLSSRGSYYQMNNTIENAFKNWTDQLAGNEKDSSKTNIEAYRYTRNNKKINRLFFTYSHYGWISDADECAFDYMWKNSNGNWIKVTFGLLFLSLIF